MKNRWKIDRNQSKYHHKSRQSKCWNFASRRGEKLKNEVPATFKSIKIRWKIDEKSWKFSRSLLGSIFDGFLLEVGGRNRIKIDMKWCWKNDEKMMMTRMAKKLDIGGYESIRHHGFESRGGGRRWGKPLLQYRKHWMEELEGWMLPRKAETTCRPEGWWDFLYDFFGIFL